MIHGMTARKDAQVIKAHVPLSEMFGYATRMRSMTQEEQFIQCNFHTT